MTSAPAVAAKGAGAQNGFQLDLNLCTGCGACAIACAIENELPWGTSWRWIETFNPDRIPGLPLHHLSLACNHCADAPCMEHCPALAYTKDPRTGAVLLDQDHCIGCRYCTWACPYDAPRFEPELGVVSKCTFCHERQLEGFAPACVSQCPTGALSFGGVTELSGSEDIPGFPDTAAEPSIRFVPLRGDTAPSPSSEDLPERRPERAPASKTSLRTEWPLALFSLLCALLAGVMVVPEGRETLSLGVFLALAGAAGGASFLHLGRKERAWRAVLNVRRSWLSREVALFSAFSAVSAWHLSGLAAPGWTGPAAGLVGVALLYAVDRVYAVTRTPGMTLHSARVLLTGVMVAGLVAGLPALWGGALALKGVQYVYRKGGLTPRAPLRPGLAMVRLGFGLTVPAVLLAMAAPWAPAAWVLLAVGETVDRAEFYLDLRVPTPARQMEMDLRHLLGSGTVA